MSYQSDRAWSDQYIPAITQIVGPYLLVPAPLEVDRKQATDLIVLKARDMTVAARVRRAKYAVQYPYDFTVRSHRDNGSETELRKLLHGWADWMFYGFANDPDDSTIPRWFLIDLCEFRFTLAHIGYRRGWCSTCYEQHNPDGTHFMAFDIRRFANCVIASSDPIKPLAEFET